MNTLKVYQAQDGSYYVIDPQQRAAYPVTTQDGKQLQGAPKNTFSGKNMTTSQQKEYDNLSKEASELRKERQKYQNQADTFADDPSDAMYKSAITNLERIDNRLKEIEKRQREVIGDTSNKPAKEIPTPNNTPIMALEPESSDKTSSTVSSDVPVSKDVTPSVASTDIQPQPQNIQKERLSLKDLPQEMFYNPERDKDIPQDNIVTPQQLAKIIEGIMNKYPQQVSHLTPLTIAYQLFKRQGLRIRA